MAYTVVAGLSIILSAWYTLNMIQRVFYGKSNAVDTEVKDISANAKLALASLVVIILVVGLYPSLILDITRSASEYILSKMFTN
jgi:NADH-quinone oxidoreductase subunit M